jgi:hypothetical protein
VLCVKRSHWGVVVGRANEKEAWRGSGMKSSMAWWPPLG